MGDITRRLTLYNQAYSLAWEALPERTKTTVQNLPERLDQAIWVQIREGRTDPRLIAETAVTTLLLKQQ